MKKHEIKYDKTCAAICGLFCPSCHAYIGTKEEPERLEAMAQRFNMPVEELRCEGCRSQVRSFYCRTQCMIHGCATRRGFDFCSACPDYPCQELKEFQAAAPHRIELWRSLERIRDAGPERWYLEMAERYSCSKCSTINSTYILKCRECGAEPSCAYVAEHQEEIVQARPISILKG